MGIQGRSPEIARIPARLALPDTRLGAADAYGALRFNTGIDMTLHIVRKELAKVDKISNLLRLLCLNGLRVDRKQTHIRHILLGLLIKAGEGGILASGR